MLQPIPLTDNMINANNRSSELRFSLKCYPLIFDRYGYHITPFRLIGELVFFRN